MQAKAKSFKADKKKLGSGALGTWREIKRKRNKKEVGAKGYFFLRLRNIAYADTTDSKLPSPCASAQFF